MNKRLLEINEKLIAFDTVSSKSNKACADYICNILDDLDFKITKDIYKDERGKEKVQVLASIGPEIQDGLILSGHIDTVPFENQAGWTVDPLKLQLTDGKFYGRGTCDMKVFIGQCLSVAENIELKKLQKPLHFVFTADEEVGCLGAKRIKESIQSLLKQTPLPKRAIIGEPTSFNIVNTHKGIVHFNIQIKGIGGHSSRPDRGKNAIETMGGVIEVIKQMNTEYSLRVNDELQNQFPDFPYNHLHIAMAKGGIALNMIPESASLAISYRSFPMDDPKMLFNALKERLKEFKEIEFTNLFITPGMPLSLNDELEKILKKEMQKHELQSVSFATDGGYIKSLGIETYICGPGDIKEAHTANEYINESDFYEGAVHIKNICEQLLF
jgi:acetylornithine deacetylase